MLYGKLGTPGEDSEAHFKGTIPQHGTWERMNSVYVSLFFFPLMPHLKLIGCNDMA